MSAKKADKRARIAAAIEAKKAAEQRVRQAREDLAQDLRNLLLPKEGTTWAKHPDFLTPYEAPYIWTLVCMAWGDEYAGQHGHHAVMRTSIDGDPFTRIYTLEKLMEQFVPAKARKRGKS